MFTSLSFVGTSVAVPPKSKSPTNQIPSRIEISAIAVRKRDSRRGRCESYATEFCNVAVSICESLIISILFTLRSQLILLSVCFSHILRKRATRCNVCVIIHANVVQKRIIRKSKRTLRFLAFSYRQRNIGKILTLCIWWSWGVIKRNFYLLCALYI